MTTISRLLKEIEGVEGGTRSWSQSGAGRGDRRWEWGEGEQQASFLFDDEHSDKR